MILKIIINILKKFRMALLGDLHLSGKELCDLQLTMLWKKLKNDASNPLNKSGEKFFSQNEEDGITLEIMRRIGIKKGIFAEFGVGNGTENNTLILVASGWRGFWIGGEELVFNYSLAPTRFSFFKRWVDRENVLSLLQDGMRSVKSNSLDVISLDLDGNDIYIIEKLLNSNIYPKLFIVEYNSKFPPPIKWQIEYDENHIWNDDDYFGASLTSFNELFLRHGYSLICCNFTGSNAFFVRDDLLRYFEDVSRDIKDIFFGPNYYLFKSFGHKISNATIEQMLRNMDDEIG